MRNLFYTLLLLLSTSMSFAVPIVVSNQSPTVTIPQTEYDVETYLGLLKDGGTCVDTEAFYYYIPAGLTFAILDGSTLYNGVCISEYLGSPTCDPFPLDHNGQRFGIHFVSGSLTEPFEPLFATTEHTIDCHPNMGADIITPTSYEKTTADLKITYMRFGNALATIDYE